MKKITSTLLLGLLASFAVSALAAEEPTLREIDVPHDPASLQRGAETVATVCMGCHSLKYIKYRDLLAAGIDKDKVTAWRGANSKDSSMISSMTPDAARSMFSVVPPDLSLMAAARDGRARYIFSYLTGYHKNDKGVVTNSVFPVTRMPDILGSSMAADAQARAAVDENAKDVTAFLVWAADPHAQERRHMGYYVLGYVAFMTLLLYLWKKQIWREIDKRPKIR